jgi:hypothetical protein
MSATNRAGVNYAGPGWHHRALGVGLLTLLAALVLGLFYNRSWLPHDDGAYAHVADRILQGEILNRDVQDVHTGLVNFANAFAMTVFGKSLPALRIPLLILGIVQSVLVFLMVCDRGMIPATASSIAMTSFGFIQFPNPTAHWYCLFLFVLLIAWLKWTPHTSRGRLEVAGLLLMSIFLFRQLTGVLAAIGVLTYLLCETPAQTKTRSTMARGLILLMAGGLLGYLATKSDWLSVALYGSWPLALLAWSWLRVSLGNREFLFLIGRLAAGAFLALAPLLIYHLVNHSLSTWLDDTVFAAEALTRLSFFDDIRYTMFVTTGVSQVLRLDSFPHLANGVMWAALPLAASGLGCLVVCRHLCGATTDRCVDPLPFLAVFYALVSLHFQASMYLFYTIGLTASALIWVASSSRLGRRVAPFAVVSLAVIAIYFHAGQSTGRGELRIVRGVRDDFAWFNESPRGQIWIPHQEAALYTQLLRMIEHNSERRDEILALPVNPELYFLTGRKCPVRFFNSALGLRSQDELAALQQQIMARPPALVVLRPNQVYNTPLTQRLMQFIRQRYALLAVIGEFEIYRPAAAPDSHRVAVGFADPMCQPQRNGAPGRERLDVAAGPSRTETP